MLLPFLTHESVDEAVLLVDLILAQRQVFKGQPWTRYR